MFSANSFTPASTSWLLFKGIKSPYPIYDYLKGLQFRTQGNDVKVTPEIIPLFYLRAVFRRSTPHLSLPSVTRTILKKILLSLSSSTAFSKSQCNGPSCSWSLSP